MTEHQVINKKDVWIKIDPWHIDRNNPNIIPTEYFTASYYFQQPENNASDGEIMKDDNGEPKLFESPVAAVSYVEKKLESIL